MAEQDMAPLVNLARKAVELIEADPLNVGCFIRFDMQEELVRVSDGLLLRSDAVVPAFITALAEIGKRPFISVEPASSFMIQGDYFFLRVERDSGANRRFTSLSLPRK